MDNRKRCVALAWAVALAGATPLLPGTWRSPAALNPAGAPFELLQVPVASCLPSPVPGDGLSVTYSIHNTSAETLVQVGIEIVSLSATGQLKAFQTYTGGVRIAPGERTVNSYTTAGYRVAPGDRLIMLPYSARGGALRWQVPDAELFQRTESLVAAQGDSSPNCDEASCLDRSLCAKSCSCGISGSFCESAAGGTVTVRCTCADCRAATGPPPRP